MSDLKITVLANGPYLVDGQPPCSTLPESRSRRRSATSSAAAVARATSRSVTARTTRTASMAPRSPIARRSALAAGVSQRRRDDLRRPIRVRARRVLHATSAATRSGTRNGARGSTRQCAPAEGRSLPPSRPVRPGRARMRSATRTTPWSFAGEPRIEPMADGPYVVRGGILLASPDETTYEARTPYTLCRCGASTNKPFCDGTHSDIGFRA